MKLDPLDIIYSKCVKLRAGGVCEYCGQVPPSKRGYHTHHFIGRRHLNTRWELDNGVALDLHCHNLMADFSSIEQSFFKKRIGTKRMEELEVMARTYRKMTKERRAEIKIYLQEQIKIEEDRQ